MLCETCNNAILCESWGDYRCSKMKARLPQPNGIAECELYKKGNPQKECRCKTCEERRYLPNDDQ